MTLTNVCVAVSSLLLMPTSFALGTKPCLRGVGVKAESESVVSKQVSAEGEWKIRSQDLGKNVG